LGQKSATFLIAQTKKQKKYFWDKIHSSTSLKMCFLNVGGLKNKEGSKLEDLFFINKIPAVCTRTSRWHRYTDKAK
jgi:hypothetical protein